MSKIKQLLENYQNHIEIPWQTGKSAQQRVLFCVYPEYTEVRLRAHLDEFEIVTKQADHNWSLFDMTDMFPRWLASQKYAKSYFREPSTLSNLLRTLPQFIHSEFETFCIESNIDSNDVVAVSGIGTLFGFLKVKEVVDLIAPLVPGRLVVFFPGSYENNNYRLLDGYDGWGYLAIPITSDQ
ncbi:DUF1788 domain-containing protein [Mariniblastus sp.]|nr:DUF1788 domain-containing protein [Mariniblastus sp.]